MSIPVLRAHSLDEALDALRTATEHTRVLAGGTDLMVELQTRRTRPDRVIDLWQLHAHRDRDRKPLPISCALAEFPDGAGKGLRIGALTTCAFLQGPLVAKHVEILAHAAREVGAQQIQARATIGGNLGTASPAADLNPVLVALNAFVRVRSATGHRDLFVEPFLAGYRKTLRRPDELIECVYVPARARGERRAFRKVGTRRAQSIAKVVVAACAEVEGGKVKALRAAAGSVAERTVVLHALAKALVGQAPTPELIDTAARASAAQDIAPIDDVRSTREYRRHALHRMLRTMLGELLVAR